MSRKMTLPGLAAMLALSLSAARAHALDAETGMDVLHRPDTRIEGLHRLFVGVPLGHGISLGQSVYSAAIGDAGGAFLWGYEAVARRALTSKLDLLASGFIGGGGGAAQVVGDGLMYRLGLSLATPISARFDATLGLAQIGISGGDERATALSMGVRYAPERETTPAPHLPALRSVALSGLQMRFARGTTRSGLPQGTVSLIGTELAFHGGPTGEWFVGGDGAATGGEGYMQLFAGLRARRVLGQIGGLPVRGFGEGSLGFGGGGEVNSGGGPLLRAGLGVEVPVAQQVALEFALGSLRYPDSKISGHSLALRLVQKFTDKSHAHSGVKLRWQLSTGITQQIPNRTFRKPGVRLQGAPLMQETALDLFVSDNFYVSGNAQTVLGGNAAGYAIGLMGVGYQQPLTPAHKIAFEALVGAAGGGGVAADGGALYAVSAGLDLRITPEIWAALAVGKFNTFAGTGMAPEFVSLGLKFPLGTP